MIKVRRNCFETNSSSTHSISIEDSEHRDFEYVDIPRNETIIIDKPDFYRYNNNETEWTKLNALIDFIIGYYDSKNKDYDDYPVADYVDTEKPLFDIIRKLIKNERNSEIILNFPNGYIYKSDKYIRNSLSILGLFEDSLEKDIYNRFKKIIFDSGINFRHQHIEC